jgi:hypothetical protein
MDERRRQDLEKRLYLIKTQMVHVTQEARGLTKHIDALVEQRHALIDRWRKLRNEQNRIIHMLEASNVH